MNTNDQSEIVTQEVTFQNYPFKHSYPELVSVYDYQRKRLTQNMTKINFVVTHGNCSDGFTSSTIVRMYLKSIGVDLGTVTFFDAFHGSDFSKLPDMMRDKFVIICDFSFSKVLFDKMVDATHGNILVLDHHKTAQEALKDVLPGYLVFDMNHSGAFITWTYFFGFDNVPKAVLYVEDNDIWTKKLPKTLEFTAYMFSRKFDFDEYEKFFDDKYLTDVVFPTASGMVLQNKTNLADLTKSCIPQFIQTSDGRYYFVACINSAGLLRSDLGNFVFTKYKNANLSMVYSHNQYVHSTSISYRSLDDRSDSTEIAKLNGGGGHRNASGASIPFMVTGPPGRLIDSYRAYFMLDDLYEVDVGNDTKSLKFLALNSSSVKKHLAKYLMQDRFINKDGEIKNKVRSLNSLPNFQEGMFCMRQRLENPTYDCVYTGAYVWHYDGHNDTYKTTVKVLPKTFYPTKIDELSESVCKIVDLKNDLYEIETSGNITPVEILGMLSTY